MTRIWQLVGAATIAAAIPLTAPAQTAAYPNKPIRLIVAYPAGGANDIVARIVGKKLGDVLGQGIIIDNRPGGGTALGATLAARAAPDGYTLFMGSLASHATSPFLIKDPGYDPVKDFVPISLLGQAPIVLVVNNDFPASNAVEFLALVKKSPGKYNYASAGNGSPPHLAAEIYKAQTGTQIEHVPYKGGTAHLIDLQAGRVDAIFDTTISSMSFIKSGKLKALAIALPKRSAELPNVQTFAEAGLPGFELTAWYGLLAPAGTPADVIKTLNAAVLKVLAMPDVQEQLRALSIEPAGSSPQQFAALIDAELAKYGKAIRDAGIKAE